ncbi:MAG: DUF697 domain-containing protein [Thiohalocapsa sp. PB-PSB1]|nr:MAG: DUF697 domain-containing protein [Thiohalocapsa sp. PB-PSB1]
MNKAPNDDASLRACAAADMAEKLTRDIDSVVRCQQAENLIKSHVLSAATVGLVPFPVFDAAALVVIQVAMIRSLAALYQIAFDEIRAKAMLMSLVSGSIPTLSVIALSSGAKLLPGIGTLPGSGGIAVAGSAITYAMGRALIYHFEQGGTLLKLNRRALRSRFRGELKQALVIGRKRASHCRADSKDVSPAAPA